MRNGASVDQSRLTESQRLETHDRGALSGPASCHVLPSLESVAEVHEVLWPDAVPKAGGRGRSGKIRRSTSGARSQRSALGMDSSVQDLPGDTTLSSEPCSKEARPAGHKC